MTLTRTEGPLSAVQDLLENAISSRRVEVDTAVFSTGTITIEVITPPSPQWFRMGGPDKARMLIQVTCCEATRTDARRVGDEVRHALTAVTTRGKPLRPLVAEGYRFDVPRTGGDGRADTTGGVHTWAETFAITWQYRVTDPPGE